MTLVALLLAVLLLIGLFKFAGFVIELLAAVFIAAAVLVGVGALAVVGAIALVAVAVS